ncbi:MAG: AmmeMemoRadiSam system radical SAM enzyme [Firmicutes bacterium]|nr:AmmeMemoRadiSam system radical SAM enzyme [Bacillota bacterium]
MKEARYYTRNNSKISCELCPQGCLLSEGQTGICGVRKVEKGKLVTLNYALCAAMNIDPIEKKPLYHFYPGWEILSVGTIGCNLHCSFCQNWSLARGDRSPTIEKTTPGEFLDILQERPLRQQLGIAYTYNEPTIWYEFVLETAQLMAENGYKNVLVSNGLINKQPLQELLPYIQAMNIDVKSFSEEFYRQHCKGRGLKEVKRTVEQAHSRCHVELTYLIVTTLNDSREEIEDFVNWVASVDKEIPVHFSRYFPSYRLKIPPTPPETIRQAWETAKEKLSYVYVGNVMDPKRSATYCPFCNRLLIDRSGYRVKNEGLKGKKCKTCGNTIRLTGHIYGEG